MRKVILSIGHHDNDPGAVANNTTEHLEAKKIVTTANTELLQKGVEIFIPPTNLILSEKINWINQYFSSEDFLIEVHLNSSVNTSATGISTWYCDGNTTEKSIAEYFASALATRINLNNGGARPDTSNNHGRLAIVRDTIPHGWLFEIGFITNSSDLQKIRQKGVLSIVDCILDLFLGGNPLLLEDEIWPFRDVPPSHFAFDAIKKAKKSGVISGYQNQTFRPNEGISRGETMVILDRLGIIS